MMVPIKRILFGLALCAATLAGCEIQELIDFIVDGGLNDGPGVNVQSPQRGAFCTSYQDQVKGSVTDSWAEVATVTVNGNQVTLGADRTFTTSLKYDFGVNRIETIASSSDGQMSTDRRCVLAGSYLQKGEYASHAIAVRLNQGTLDTLNQVAQEFVDDLDPTDYIPSPLYSATSSMYELHVDLGDLGYDGVNVDFGTTGSGTISATAFIENLDIPIKAEGVVAGAPYAVETGIGADKITLSLAVTPSVNNGVISTNVSDLDLVTEGFQFDFPNWIYEAAEFFGIDIDQLLQGLVEDALEEIIAKVARDTIETSFNDLAIRYDIPLLGTTYQFSATPAQLDVDERGATLVMDTSLVPQQWKLAQQGEGSLYSGYAEPTYDSSSDAVLAFSADFLNQALYAFWGGGLIDLDLGPDEIALPELNLPFLPDKLPNFRLVIKGMLPPVVLPGSGNHLLDMQLGDVEIRLYAGDSNDQGNLLLALYVGFDAGFSFSISNQQTLSPNISDVDSWFDFAYPPIPCGWENDLESFVRTILQQQLLPLLIRSIGSIPIPDMPGIELTSIKIGQGGAESGYVTVGTDVSF